MSWVAAAIVAGGDWMPVGRFLLPAFVLFAISATGFPNVIDLAKRRFGDTKIVVFTRTIVFSLTALCLWFNYNAADESARRAQNTLASTIQELRFITMWANEAGVQSAGVVDIGYFGFHSPIEIFDFAGLTDSVIARSPGGAARALPLQSCRARAEAQARPFA